MSILRRLGNGSAAVLAMEEILRCFLLFGEDCWDLSWFLLALSGFCASFLALSGFDFVSHALSVGGK